MGKRGPRQKLAVIEALEGNPGKRVIEESGIEALGEPFVAEHLCDDARGCIEVIKQSMPSNVYSALDSFLLSAFAMAWVTYKRATHEINAPPAFNGRPQASAAVRRRVPGSGLQTNRRGSWRRSANRLGLDPKSRAALKLPAAKQRKSKFDGLRGATAPASTYKN